MGRKRDSKGRYTKGGRGKSRRRRNPSLGKIKNMSVGGVKVYPAAYDAVGVVGGAYAASAFANFVSGQLVGRLPGAIQGVGFLLSGIGTIMLGRYSKKALKTDLPVDYAFIAMAVPLLTSGLRVLGAPGFAATAPTGPPPTDVPGETVQAGTMHRGMGPGMGRAMRGTLQAGGLPGSMGGTIQPRSMPGSMGRSLLRRVM